MLKFLPILLIFLFLLTGCNGNNNSSTNSSEASRISTQENIENNGTPSTAPTPTPFVPIQLGTFTTTIYTKTSERQNNVKIACEELNGTIVGVRRNIFIH